MKKTSLILAILIMSIGFASISTTLIINGSNKINENEDDFEIIFTKATLDNVDVYESVISEDKKTITFTSNDLKKLNDTSTLNYEVTNNSNNYDAEVVINCNVKENTTAEYTSITNTLEDNKTIISAKESVNGTLTITLDKVSTTEITEEYTCTLDFYAVERDTLGTSIPEPVSFSTDSWATIQKAVKLGNTNMYNVGDTKTITIAEHTSDCATGSYYNNDCTSGTIAEQELIVRISNKEKCTTKISETACGFVIEFVDIIEKYYINTTTTNVGGWKDSIMRSYLNSTILTSLPSDLQNVIANTKVISGHGDTRGETNFKTTDKLYLLTTKEVYGEAEYDTVDTESKQLEYYKNKEVTLSNYEDVIKKFNGNAYYWWLRSTHSSDTNYFLSVSSNGFRDCGSASRSSGISPAFRIA